MKKKLNSRRATSPRTWRVHAPLTIALAVLSMCSEKKEKDIPLRDDPATRAVSRGIVAAVKTVHPRFASVSYPLEVTGVVTYDPRRIHTISARVSGRLEKMYVKYPFQQIDRGQRIAEMYSPELNAAARELQLVAARDPENEGLVSAAKERLRLFGLRDSEINDAMRGRNISTFPLYSPYTGYVLPGSRASDGKSPSISESAAAMGKGMEAARQNGEAATSLPRDGDYVSAGETLLRIVNADAVRVEFDLHHFSAGAVASGDTITVTSENEPPRKAIVDFTEPYVDRGETFFRMRVVLDNAARLTIGQLVKGTINVRSPETLWLPREAVVNLGSQEVVFAKVHDAFLPVSVSSGVRTGKLIEIKSGLATGDEVAANAHFLKDRDSFIKPVNTHR